MTPKWDLIGLGGDLGDFWFVVQIRKLKKNKHNSRNLKVLQVQRVNKLLLATAPH